MIWSSPPMRDDDGRKLDHKTLEQLRLRAVRQIEQGAHPEDVAAALRMPRGAEEYSGRGLFLAGQVSRGGSGGAQGPPSPRTATKIGGRPTAAAVHAGGQ